MFLDHRGEQEGRNLRNPSGDYMGSQIVGNNWPLYPKVDHHWFQVAHSYEPLAVWVHSSFSSLLGVSALAWPRVVRPEAFMFSSSGLLLTDLIRVAKFGACTTTNRAP